MAARHKTEEPPGGYVAQIVLDEDYRSDGVQVEIDHATRSIEIRTRTVPQHAIVAILAAAPWLGSLPRQLDETSAPA